MIGQADLKRSGIYALAGFVLGALTLFAVIDYQSSLNNQPFFDFLANSDANNLLYVLIVAIPSVCGVIVGSGRSQVKQLRQRINDLATERDKLLALRAQTVDESAKLKALLNQESGYFVENWDQLVTEKENLREEAEISSSLLKVALAIGSLAGPDEALRLLTDSLPAALFADNCLTFTWDADAKAYVSNSDLNLELRPRAFAALNRLLTKKVPVAIDDVGASGLIPRKIIEQLKIRSAILIPCVRRDFVAAIAMVIYIKATHSFSDRDIQIASGIVSQATVVLENAHLYGEIKSSHSELQRLMTRLASSQEEERRRISRDLHDGVIQNLSGMIFSLSFLEKALGQSDQGAIDEIAQLVQIVEGTIADIRQVIYDLRPTILDTLGLVPTLEKHLERFGANNSIEISYNPQLSSRLPETVETGLFRLAQEALNNIKKHAEAKKVTLDLKRIKKQAIMTIKDNGRGFDPLKANDRASQDSGFGLSGMRERVQSLGGNVEITSKPGSGTEVTVTVPMATEGA